MAGAIEAHIRELESETQDAERDADEFREQMQKRIEEMNLEITQLVAKVQIEKDSIKERIARKDTYARRKAEELSKFRASLYNPAASLTSTPTATYQAASSRPSIVSEPTRTSLTSVDDIREHPTTAGFTPVNNKLADPVDLPKSVVKSTDRLPPQEPSAIISQQKYLQNVPIICKGPNGNWLEIRCMLCHGNYIDKKGWIKGARGMLAHANKSHKVDTFGGRRLDSTNILEFCTHRQVSDNEVEQMIDNVVKPDIIPVRDVNNINAQFTASTPKVTKVPLAKGQAPIDEGDLPYDWLLRYPTIVLRKDSTWVELRCDICGGNSLANSDKRFAQGVIGFVRHLSRGHSIRPTRPNSRLEWAMERCTYRVVPQEEITALTEGLESAPPPPPKIPFKQSSNVRLSTDSQGELQAPTKRPRAAKRSSELLYDSDDGESELEPDVADSDFDPSHARGEAKRARHSIPIPSPKQPLRGSKKSRASGTSHSVPASPVSSTAGLAKGGALDRFCPCSIGGHECHSSGCNKLSVCTLLNHDEACRKSGVSHDVKPSCVMGVLSAECPDGDLCNRGHDHLEERRKIAQTHNCQTH